MYGVLCGAQSAPHAQNLTLPEYPHPKHLFLDMRTIVFILFSVLASLVSAQVHKPFLEEHKKGLHDKSLASTKQVLKTRLEQLKTFASVSKHSSESSACSTTKFVVVTEYAFGRSGNNLIEFTHGLWIAKLFNATFAPPIWMQGILQPFDTTLLNSLYCYSLTPDSLPSGAEIIDITSEDSFFLFKLFSDTEYWKDRKAILPALNHDTVLDISLHFLQVYATLWSKPNKPIIRVAERLLAYHLDNTFRYTAVHKRNMEGGCAKLFQSNSVVSDFSKHELPINSIPEWQPDWLCTMPVDFVLQTMAMHHRNGSRIFIAYDGQGEVDSYRKHGAVFASDVFEGSTASTAPTHGLDKDNTLVDLKFVDMFMAINADFFILNPRSTYSWEIYLIRVILGLQSVPVIENNDLYLQRVPQALIADARPLWVSWTSVIAAYLHDSL